MKLCLAITILWLATTLAALALHYSEPVSALWTQAILGQVAAVSWCLAAAIYRKR